MIRNKRKCLFLLALLSMFGLGFFTNPFQAQASPAFNGSVNAAAIPGLVGRWVSSGCETRSAGGNNKLYVKRDTTFKEDSSALTLVVFADANCQTPNLTFVFDGPYTVGRASAAVPGAYEADFKFTNAKLTPQNEGVVQLLNSAAPNTCGKAAWQVNGTQDITGTSGCSVLGVDLKACPGEYDLLKVEGDKLYYGERPADGSGPCKPEQRPTTLQVPLVRSGASTPIQAPSAGQGGTNPGSGFETAPWLIGLLITTMLAAFSLIVVTRRRTQR